MENRQSIFGEIIAKLLIKLGIRSAENNAEIIIEKEDYTNITDISKNPELPKEIHLETMEDDLYDRDIWSHDMPGTAEDKWDAEEWYEEEIISLEHRTLFAQYGYNPIKIAKLQKIDSPVKPALLPRIIDSHEFELQITEMENQVIHVLGEDFRSITESENGEMLKPQKITVEDAGAELEKRVEQFWGQVELTDDETDVLNSNQYVAEIKEIYKHFLLYKKQMITREEYETFKDDCLAEYWEKEPNDVVYQKQMKALRRLEL